MSYSAVDYFRTKLVVGKELPTKILAQCCFCGSSETHPFSMALLLKGPLRTVCLRCGWGTEGSLEGPKSIYDLVMALEGCSYEEARRVILAGAVRRVRLRGTVGESLAQDARETRKKAPRIPTRWLERFRELRGPVAAVRRAVLYLEGRGIGPEEVERYGIRLGRGEFENRVMIPVIEGSEVLFFTGRSIFAREKFRYRDAVRGADCACGKDEVVFNLGAVKALGHLVLTEGPFDAIWADMALREGGFPAVAGSPFGKRASQAQIARLLERGVKRVTLMLDSVGVSEAEEALYLDKLRPHFSTNVVWLPRKYKDPAEIPPRILVDMVRLAQPVTNRLAYMQAKLAGGGRR